MGTNVKRKKAVAKQVLDIFLRENKILDTKEWTALKDKPCTVATLRMHLGSWNRMLARIRTQEPERWALIGTEEGKNHITEKKSNSLTDNKAVKPNLVTKLKDAITPEKSKKNPDEESIDALKAALDTAAKAKASVEPEKG